MIEIFEKTSVVNAHYGCIIHGLSQMGVMGAGVALALRTKYPSIYREYKAREKEKGLHLGDVGVEWVTDCLAVVNAITQPSYGRQGSHLDTDALRRCFQEVDELIYEGELDEPIHLPTIGCSLGGGDWEEVLGIIEEELGHRNVIVHLNKKGGA